LDLGGGISKAKEPSATEKFNQAGNLKDQDEAATIYLKLTEGGRDISSNLRMESFKKLLTLPKYKYSTISKLLEILGDNPPSANSSHFLEYDRAKASEMLLGLSDIDLLLGINFNSINGHKQKAIGALKETSTKTGKEHYRKEAKNFLEDHHLN
jgi:hypothetical protein